VKDRKGRSTTARKRQTRRGLGKIAVIPACLLCLPPFSCTVLALALLLASCAEREAPREKPEFAVDKLFTRGPLSVRLRLDKTAITIADTFHLAIEATATEDYDVALPRFGENLEQFGIVDYITQPLKLLGDGKVSMGRTYELEPLVSGEYKVPRMKVVFTRKAKGKGESKTYEIETEEVAVKVESLLDKKRAELKIRDIAGPVSLPPRRVPWYAWVGGGGLLLAIGAAVFLILRRRRTEAQAVVLAPHEIAYRQLEALVARGLIEKGEVKAFYDGVSDILRYYIEGRFGLHAPERTTEEFLPELRRSRAFQPRHKALLGEFLRHCDLVKFAEHQPATEEIQNTFDVCKGFIEATRSDEARTAV